MLLLPTKPMERGGPQRKQLTANNDDLRTAPVQRQPVSGITAYIQSDKDVVV